MHLDTQPQTEWVILPAIRSPSPHKLSSPEKYVQYMLTLHTVIQMFCIF